MSTKYESADLILKLFDLRREPKMREARDWWYAFNPKSLDDFKAALMGADSAKLRMVPSYWETAAALVNHGAIDEAMFLDTNGEFLSMYNKTKPFLNDIRQMMPTFLVQVEKLVSRMPAK